MKKIPKKILVAAAIFGLMGNVDALTLNINEEDVANDTYIIGTHMFTTDRDYLSTQHIMLAARTITGDEALENMIIYYKDFDGNWINGITGEDIEVPKSFDLGNINAAVNQDMVLAKAISTSNLENEDNINAFISALFGGESGNDLQTEVTNITVNKALTISGNKITIDQDKITDGMLEFIKANYGGTAIPVAFTVNNSEPSNITKDTNWDNQYLVWVDLNPNNVVGEISHNIDLTNKGIASYIIQRVAPTEKDVVISNPIFSAESANKDNMNLFMSSLWNGLDSEKEFGFKIESIFKFDEATNTLTIDNDKITEQLLTFINTNYGGSSVPVKLVFNKGVTTEVGKDTNWSNDYLTWIDISKLDKGETSFEITMNDGTKTSYKIKVVSADKDITISNPVFSAESANKDNMNLFMSSLWNGLDSEKEFGFKIEAIFSYDEATNTLTINTDKITEQLLTFINTNYGGSSVPVKLVFNKGVTTEVGKDANWSNDYLVWIDLANLQKGKQDITINMTDKATATYVLDVLATDKVVTLEKPVWIFESENKDNLNFFINGLFNGVTESERLGFTFDKILTINGNELIINRANLTQSVLDFINTNYGGSMVPVKVMFNKGETTQLGKDANWDNSYIVWIDLLKEQASTVNIEMTDKSNAAYKISLDDASLTSLKDTKKLEIDNYLSTELANDYEANEQAIAGALKVLAKDAVSKATNAIEIKNVVEECIRKINTLPTK